MKTDTQYLRSLSENKNLPGLMRDAMRDAAAEIERMREWSIDLVADKERLDWLADRENTIGNVQLPTMCVMNNLHDMRAAIDEAMRIDPEAWAEVGGADAGETFNAV